MDGIRGVIFDMDGTLVDSPLDFRRIREECGVPPDRPVLEHLESLGQAERRRVEAILARHEHRAASECTVRDGAAEVVAELKERGYRTALLTRNSADSVRAVLERFPLALDCWVSREHACPKPSPEPVLRIARSLELEPRELLVVGDYLFDVQAGKAAGSRTAFLETGRDVSPPDPDCTIFDLNELLDVLPPLNR
ncbi:MAG: HAD family hydrolase [Candidatus Brocadiia bacterium]